MSVIHAIAAQFERTVPLEQAAARVAICEACPKSYRTNFPGMRYLLRCPECRCLVSVEGEPKPVVGFRPKTMIEGQSCPEGRW